MTKGEIEETTKNHICMIKMTTFWYMSLDFLSKREIIYIICKREILNTNIKNNVYKILEGEYVQDSRGGF